MSKIPNPIIPPNPAINTVSILMGILKNGNKLNRNRSIRPKNAWTPM